MTGEERPGPGPGLPPTIDRGVLRPVETQTTRDVKVAGDEPPSRLTQTAWQRGDRPVVAPLVRDAARSPGLPNLVQTDKSDRPQTAGAHTEVPVPSATTPEVPTHDTQVQRHQSRSVPGLPGPALRGGPRQPVAAPRRDAGSPGLPVGVPGTAPASGRPGLPDASGRQTVSGRPGVAPTIREETVRRSPGLPPVGAAERSVAPEPGVIDGPSPGVAPDMPQLPAIEGIPFFRSEPVYRDGQATYQPPRFT